MSHIFDFDAQEDRLAQRRTRPNGAHGTLPAPEAIRAAETSLPRPGSPSFLAGRSDRDTHAHVVGDIVPALTGQALSRRYYGFVTGGVLPLAEWADGVVSAMDQNVQVHLPEQTVATAVEDAALAMLVGLLRLGEDAAWKGRTFTTGATASNVLGLACGREAVLAKKLGPGAEAGVGELGLLRACAEAGVTEIQVLTSAAHSSLSKAASVVGFGRRSVKELRLSDEEPWRLDLAALERQLQVPGTASVIAISAGEVNTGRFAIGSVDEMRKVRALADKYGAWIHVDGAFGIFVRALEDKDEYKLLHKRVEGLELADSITVDGHKLLNVPYDCGMFLTRSHLTLQSVFTNPNAAYLSSGSQDSIPSPLNIGLENSRRFRALPAYVVLLSEGRSGIAGLLANMVELSRKVAAFLRESDHYELLPDESADLEETFMIVLFRAKDPAVNDVLVEKINETRQMYVSGTKWAGQKAVRMAVSTWKVDVARDHEIVRTILANVAEGKEFDIESCRD
ncbi:pyridoxal phosphate-dependent transferase [Dactylonectria estremocensis]|uniref:Pyridoxal phosphate-dependent transferase n=1 Tax=Dactylonectria estremocensis TaxID=1079267 RepID=A0A9P9J5Z0_9HYPO|nr:pyridoxal phosphate-dependent transferase [Dactylonectria estremocensis]